MKRILTKSFLVIGMCFYLFSMSFAHTSNTTNSKSKDKSSNQEQVNNGVQIYGLETAIDFNSNQSDIQSAKKTNNPVGIFDINPVNHQNAKQANFNSHIFKGNPSKVPPVNDDICSSIELSVGAPPVTGDNSEATTEPGEPTPTCYDDNAIDSTVWYYFFVAGPGTYTVTTDLAVLGNNDTQLGLFTSSDGTCSGTLTQVACNEDVDFPNGNYLAEVDYLSAGGDTIWVQVDGWGGTSGTFEIQVTFVPAPAGGDAAIASTPLGSGIAGGYTDVPMSQSNGNNVDFDVEIDNLGTIPITNVVVQGTTFPLGMVSGSVASIPVGGSAIVNTSSFAATPFTTYGATFTVDAFESDPDTTNNLLTYSFQTAQVGDSVYARENSIAPTAAVGSNTGVLRLANTFVVSSTDTLSSMTVNFGGDPAGKTFDIFVGDFNGTADIFSATISGLSGVGFYEFPVGLELTPGTYVVGVNQTTTAVNVAVGLDTAFKNVGGSFFGTYGSWTDILTVGSAGLEGALLIRANFGDFTAPAVGGNASIANSIPSGTGIAGGYTNVPLSQNLNNDVSFDVNVANIGNDSLTGLTLTGLVNPGASSITGNLAQLNAGAVGSISTNTFTATPATSYTADFNVTSNEVDLDTTNNSLSYPFTTAAVGDSVYARENSTTPTAAVGSNTGVLRLANTFEVHSSDTLTSITVTFGGDPVGKTFDIFVGDFAGTADIYSSTISGLSGVGAYTFDIGGLILTPGTYVVGVNQTTTAVNVAVGLDVAFKNVNASYFGTYGGWTDIVTAGIANLDGNLMIKANFGTSVSTTLSPFTLTAPADGTILDVMGAGTQTVNITWNATTATPTAPVNYEWLLDVQGGNFSNPLASIPAGTNTNLTLTYTAIDNLLASLGVTVGNTIQTSWTVRATAPGAALLATSSFDLDLIRSGLSSSSSRDFEAYNAGDLIVANDSEWEFWPGATLDAPVSVAQSQSGANSLLIDGAPNQDLVFKLGDQTSGTWGVGFSIYIPSGNGAYYNLQETEVPGVRWPIGNVVFDPAGTGTIDGVTPAATFSFPHDQWFDVRNYVDLDNDTFQVWIDNSLAASGVWTAAPPQGGGTAQLQLGGINIFPEGAGGTTPAQKVFYLDDMYFQPDSLRTSVNYTFSPFNLTSPPDQTRLEVQSGNATPIVITWDSTVVTPAGLPTYRWILEDQGGNQILNYASDNGGIDNMLTRTSGALDAALNNAGIDSIDAVWNVEASVSGQSAFASNGPFNIRLIRATGTSLDANTIQRKVSFYPNPTEGQLIVKVRDNAAKAVIIKSMIGQSLKSFEINSTTNVLDLSDLSSGMYIITFLSDNEEYSQKVIIE